MADRRIDFEFTKSYLKSVILGYFTTVVFIAMWTQLRACDVQAILPVSSPEVLNNLAYVSVRK